MLKVKKIHKIQQVIKIFNIFKRSTFYIFTPQAFSLICINFIFKKSKSSTHVRRQLTREAHHLVARFVQLTFQPSNFIRLSLFFCRWTIHGRSTWHEGDLAAVHWGKLNRERFKSWRHAAASPLQLPSSFFFGYVRRWLALCVGESSPVKPREGGVGLVGWLHGTAACALTGKQ